MAKFFQMKISIGKKNYILPRVVNINSFQRNFQYIILHNILYLNKMLFTSGKTKTPLCSFCHSCNETIQHIFLECIFSKQLWSHLRLFLTNDISLLILTPQTVIFGITNGIENSKITNHILLISKVNVYESRERVTLELNRLIK